MSEDVLCPRCAHPFRPGRASTAVCPACSQFFSVPASNLGATLTVVEGAEAGRSFFLGCSLTLGSSDTNLIQLFDDDCSPVHTRLIVRSDRVEFVDLKSRDGTLVNGERRVEGTLVPGDELQVGRTRLRFEVGHRPGTLGQPCPPFQAPAGPPRRASIVAELPSHPDSQLFEPPAVEEPGAGRLEKRFRKLRMVYAANEAISEITDLDRLLERILDVVLDVVPADRGALLLKADGIPRQQAVRSRPGAAPFLAEDISQSIVSRVLSEGVSLLTEDPLQDDRFEAKGTFISKGVRSALCTPLIHREEIFGVFYLDSTCEAGAFDTDDLEALLAISRQAAISLENARLLERSREEAVIRNNLERYLPAPLVEQVLRGTVSLEPGGKAATVTVLFTDLRGFTAMSAGLAPAEVVRIMNAYFEEMVDVVFRFGGTLDKYIGDALMAVWGVPVARPDDALQAVRCAVEMLARLERFNLETADRSSPRLTMGVGINSGEVIVGNLGARRRMEYTSIGATVNLASRLEGLNKELGTSILLGPATYEQVREKIQAKPMGATRVKGLQEPVPVYCVGAVAPPVAPGPERRTTVRPRLSALAACTLGGESRPIKGVVLDLSSGGAGLALRTAVPVGTAIRIRVLDGGGTEVVVLEGAAVWCESAQSKLGKNYHRVGVKFDSPLPGVEAIIDRLAARGGGAEAHPRDQGGCGERP